jgi:hypothetical protein
MHKLKLAVAVPVALGALAGVAVAASSPTVTTGAATSVATGSAVLNGTLNPNGAKTSYSFQWGPTTAFGSQSKPGSAGAGAKSVSVKSTAAGLVPGTTYYYRLDATNGAGSAVGATRTFRTAGNPPPGATTGAAQNVSKNSATVTGVVYPQKQATTYFFQYGLSSSYGLQTAPLTVAAGTAPVPVSVTIGALESGTTFHYRLFVEHGSQALNAGSDASFETLPSPAPRPKVTASTSPRSTRKLPAGLTTVGKVTGPASTPASLDCVGQVKVSYFLGRRRVLTTTAAVQPDCTFAAVAHFRKLPGKGPKGRTVRLTLRIRFGGNSYLAAASARNETVKLR